MSHRILIVDDERAFLLGIRKVMEPLGAVLDLTDTLKEAEQYLAGRSYDLVITDLRLTNVMSEEGLEILRLVKERSPATPCILITGYGSAELREKVLALGAARYFEKPVPPQELLEAVRGLLSA